MKKLWEKMLRWIPAVRELDKTARIRENYIKGLENSLRSTEDRLSELLKSAPPKRSANDSQVHNAL